MIGNILNQATNILSGRPKDLESTTTGTTGSAAGQDAAQWGIDQMQGHIAGGPGTFTGRHPGTQGPNAAQTQQYNILQGMYGSVPGGVKSAVGDMTSQQIIGGDRSGGPGSYADNRNKLLEDAARKRYADALAMGSNQIGQGAHGANAFGGSRHAMASGAMGAKAMQDYMQQTGQLYADSYDKGMGWKHEDARAQAANVDAMNRANLGFGGLRRGVAGDDISNLSNLASQYGQYGQGQQQQQNLADQFGYGEFLRGERWLPSQLGTYSNMVANAPWQQQTSSTQYGSAPSDLMNLGGATLGLGGAAMMGGWKPWT